MCFIECMANPSADNQFISGKVRAYLVLIDVGEANTPARQGANIAQGLIQSLLVREVVHDLRRSREAQLRKEGSRGA